MMGKSLRQTHRARLNLELLLLLLPLLVRKLDDTINPMQDETTIGGEITVKETIMNETVATEEIAATIGSIAMMSIRVPGGKAIVESRHGVDISSS